MASSFIVELPLLRAECLHFEELFPTSSFSTLHSHQESSRIPISSNLVIIIFLFNKISLTATLASVKWYLVVLICISLGLITFNFISCVCESFWCILWRYFSLLKPFILLYLGHWFALELWCCFLYSGQETLLGMWFANIFYYIVSHLFTCLICPSLMCPWYVLDDRF